MVKLPKLLEYTYMQPHHNNKHGAIEDIQDVDARFSVPPSDAEPDATKVNTAADSGLACLLLMAGLHGIAADPQALRHRHANERGVLDSTAISLAARDIGMTARLVKSSPQRLGKVPLPAIACSRAGQFFILARHAETGAEGSGAQVMIMHPGSQPEVLLMDKFLAMWSGDLILLTSKATYAQETARFDFSWFIPAIVKYRHLLGEVLLMSLVLQLIGLATPMFFQVVMDKVLVNHAMKTLNVVAIGLLCATLFEVVLGGIRSWVMAHTSSKIDVELGARLFRHLMALPIAYFESRRVGDSVARVRELENIRSFLTGNAITVVLDLVFSVVFIAVMLWYSVWLTLVVLASIPLYVLLSVFFTPVLRNRLDEKFRAGAENQSFLVETISSVGTVKAMAVEPRWAQKWERQLAAYVTAGLGVTNIATLASSGVTLVSKLVSVTIMWLGATLVIDGQITVGQLIAFNMLSGQVANPILRLAQLWNDFQQVGISMARLGDILNTTPELTNRSTSLPRLAGAIELDQISFRYRPDAADVIRQVSLSIREGEVIGIVGRSGSGKSTLTKLIQRLYVPDRGRVLVDGQDIAIVDAASLRRQIGVVLQENNLFNRSVRDNIALSEPTASMDVVMEAARLAGAHDFICELAQGYDTVLGEHGVGLSGGQRQRIAIARALISNPRLLIFDEATSALDYESEKIVQDNMRSICSGRTVLIIAHRLSAVRAANRIIVMERGQIVETGSHDELLQMPDGIYAHLYGLQAGTGRQP